MPVWLLSVWSFLTSKVGTYLMVAIAVVGALWWYGHHQYERGKSDQIAAEEKAGKKIVKGQTQIVHDIEIRYLPQETKIVTVTKTITKEVPRYVTLQDDSAYPINRGFVRLHDAAAEGAVPSGPAADDGAPSPVALSAVASTVAENYGICHVFATRLKMWQEWYVRNKSLFETGGTSGH